MSTDVNVKELRNLVENTRDRNFLIRIMVLITVTKALAPTFLRNPIITIKMYIKHLAEGQRKFHV